MDGEYSAMWRRWILRQAIGNIKKTSRSKSFLERLCTLHFLSILDVVLDKNVCFLSNTTHLLDKKGVILQLHS